MSESLDLIRSLLAFPQTKVSTQNLDILIHCTGHSMPLPEILALMAVPEETAVEHTLKILKKVLTLGKTLEVPQVKLQIFTENPCLPMAAVAAAELKTEAVPTMEGEELLNTSPEESISHTAEAAVEVPTLETQNQPKASLLVETEEMAAVAAAELADAEAEIIHGILPEALAATAPMAETARTAFC